jgi:pimeloyl-ACP methyl ester carboxylesterase
MLVFLHSWSFNYTQIVLPGPAGGVPWLARPTWMETMLRVPNTVVVSPNFGGANNHPEGAGHPRQMGRVKLVIDTVQVEHNCKRLVVFGYSSGGYLALMLAAAYPGMVNAASVWMSIDDLAAWHREFPVMRATVEACLGGPPEGREEAYLARSPRGVLKRVRDANIWINSAESDDVVLPHHQKDSYDRLEGLPGVKRRFRSYPGRHVWAAAENDEAVRQIGTLIAEVA